MTRPSLVPPAPGVHRNVPMSEYHAWSAAGSSGLKKLRRSPAHLKASLDEPQRETPALILGRGLHCAMLEPDSFPLLFTVADECQAIKKSDAKKCTNDGIRFHPQLGWLCGQHLRGVPGAFDDTRSALSADNYQTCLGIRDSLYNHRRAKQLLQGPGENELSIVWVDPVTGVTCKARFDRLSSAFQTIADLKSTTDASKVGFERALYSHDYHIQAAHYLDGAAVAGIDVVDFVFIAVEKEPPFAVGTYRLTDGAIAAGRQLIQQLLATYARCIETGEYPAYSPEIESISLPTYAWAQIDRELTEAA